VKITNAPRVVWRWACPLVRLLKHAMSICTIEAYRLFGKEFIKMALCDQDELHSDTSGRVFHMLGVSYLEKYFGQGSDEYLLSIERGFIDCNCKKFIEVRLFCSHCL